MKPLFNPEITKAMSPLWNMSKRFALVKYGGGIIQMSGSIAGNTFARNRSGNYMRARTKPVNPNSERQGNIRASLSALVEAWTDELTDAQRIAWRLYADTVAMTNRLGESIKLSGFNHYVRSNSIRLFSGASRIDPGPTEFSLPVVDPDLTVTCKNDNRMDIAFDDTMPWCDIDGEQIMLFMGSPQNPGKNFFAGPWRYMWRAIGNSITPPTSPTENVQGPYVITPGQKVWFYARISKIDGRLTNKFFTGPVTVAS